MLLTDKRKNEPREGAHFYLMSAKDHCRPGETISILNEDKISDFQFCNESTIKLLLKQT
jgi:hypothetical protein